MKAYPQAVEPYRDSGLGYPLPLPAGKKTPPPAGYTGAEGAVPSDSDYSEWAQKHPTGNVGLRLAPHVIGIDVDAYLKSGNQKQGAETLTRLEAAHGPLPPTWISTSRDDGISGIRLFTADPALAEEFAGNAGPDIEVIRSGHRYLVAYPSTHPEGGHYRIDAPDGTVATSVPTPDELPRLPDDWVRHLLANGRCRCETRDKTAGLLIKPHTAKYGTVKAASQALEHALNGGGSRHDTAASVTMALLRFAERGDPDAGSELDRLRDTYVSVVGPERDGGSRAAEREWERMVSGAERKIAADPSTMTTPEGNTIDHTLRFTDIDNSTRFAQLHANKLRYIPKWKKWLAWDTHSWAIDEDKVRVLELGKEVSRSLYLEAANEPDSDRAGKIAAWAKQSSNANRIEAFAKLARGIEGVAVSHNDLDTNPWLLGVRNGVINLDTGQHRPGDPDDLMHKQTNVAHDPDAECPTWDRCMADWFPSSETRRYVQRLAGSALVGKQKDHKLIIHYGSGSNGKSTFVRGIGHVLGEYFITPDKSLLVREKHSNERREKATLFRIRLAVASETERRQKLNEAQVKNLTGGDSIRAARLYENSWEFEQSHSMWLQTNYLPEINGRDAGIWRRIDVVPWVASFEGGRQDTDLDDKLRREAPGILNWLITGCLQWQQEGLAPSDEVVNVTARYRAAEDVLGRYATDIGLTFTKGLHITAQKLADELTKWCRSEGIDDPPSRNDFADWMRQNGAEHLGRKQIGGIRATWWRNAGIDETLTGPMEPSTTARGATPLPRLPHEGVPEKSSGRVRQGWQQTINEDSADADADADTLVCPSCGNAMKTIYPSGLCGDCDADQVAP